jgi:hypothetical protein
MQKFLSLQSYISEQKKPPSFQDGYWLTTDQMNQIITGIMKTFDQEIQSLKDEFLSKKKPFPKRGAFDVLKNWWYNALYGSRNVKNPYYHRNTLGHLGTPLKNEITLQQYKILKEYSDELETQILNERYYIEDLLDNWAKRFKVDLENNLRDYLRLYYRPTGPTGPVVPKADPSAPAAKKPEPITPAEKVAGDVGAEEFPDVEPPEVSGETGVEDLGDDKTEQPPIDEEEPVDTGESETEEFPDSEPIAEPEEMADEIEEPAAAPATTAAQPAPVSTPTPAANKENILSNIMNIVYDFDILDKSQLKVDKNKLNQKLSRFRDYNLSKPDNDYVMDMMEREFVIKQLFRYYEIQDQKNLPSKKLESRSPEELQSILNLLKEYQARRTSNFLNSLITRLLKIMPWPAMADSYFQKMMTFNTRKKPQPSADFRKLFENTTLYERTLLCLDKLRSR